MPNFKEVDPKQSFPKLEEEILNRWDEKDVFKKSIEKNKDGERFVFFEGPPTANGKPGIHHVLARAFKDVIPRYKSMKGYYVPRKAGWDTHGLPVELQVEKKLEISGKPQIEEYGIKEFNQQCKESVWEYKDEWEKLTKRIAFWVDLDDPYITYDNSYIESVWWILKQVNEKGLLYEGHKVVPHCPRCGTALSSHEVAQGYKDVTEPAVYIKLKLKGESDTYFLTWTTTPWTLPGNVGLAVGEDIDYVKIKTEKENYILAKARLEVIDEEYEILEEMKGANLLNIEYEQLFDSLADVEEKGWYVVPGDFVTTDSGTGIVHTAVMYGEDDYHLGQKYNLPHTHTVDEEGKFLPRVKEFTGMFVKDADKPVSDFLKEKGLLYKKENYTHSYPHCWRCDTPLLYYAKSSWFIKMSELRDELIENNKQINWIPEHIQQGRFGKWLENVKDWAISRERYWGTPLPVWKSESGEIAVIGSVEELRERAIDDLPENIDLHRPFIDDVKLRASDGSEMIREVSVLDCWLDSGSMPFAQHHYPFENKELIDNGEQFPGDFIAEAIDQTRGWFYTLLAISTVLGKGPSYKNVICTGHINDKHGKKMSKSKGNVINPWEIIDDYGVDALRWYLFTMNAPGDPKRFDPKGVEEVVKTVVLKLWNVYSFFVTYANIDNFEPQNEFTPKTHVLDKWVVSRLEALKQTVGDSLDAYDITTACQSVEQFIDELSNWYVRRSRRRFWKSENDSDKNDAYETLHYVLLETSKLIAPFMPFVSDKLYQGLNGSEQSVHLAAFPEFNNEFIDEKLNEKMTIAQTIVTLGHAARDQKKIKVRQPLQEVLIANAELPEGDIAEIVKDELNVKELKEVKNISEMADESVKLNFPVLGKRIGKRMKELHALVNEGKYEIKDNSTLVAGDFELSEDEYEKVYSSDDENFSVSESRGVVVVLNAELTEELIQEGHARELVRFIQDLRKEAEYNVDDRIAVMVQTGGDLMTSFEKHLDYIQAETLADSVTFGEPEEYDAAKDVEIDSVGVKIAIKNRQF
jgi:isoleucyl-tRNA synthetase